MKAIICLSVILFYLGSGQAFPADISTSENSSTAASVNDGDTSSISTSDSTTVGLPEDLSTAAPSVLPAEDKKEINGNDGIIETTDIIHDDELSTDAGKDLPTEASSSIESDESLEPCSDDKQENENSIKESDDEVDQKIPIDIRHNKKKQHEGNHEKDTSIFPRPYYPPPLPPNRYFFIPFLPFPIRYYPYPTHQFEWRQV